MGCFPFAFLSHKPGKGALKKGVAVCLTQPFWKKELKHRYLGEEKNTKRAKDEPFLCPTEATMTAATGPALTAGECTMWQHL